ncbi:hypothetical protein VTN77DRAFT_321 [Rasamsonia byssochlamydoides]|uniref:uncharacterized protein n=1 Tax=Rasamsonia byssochlamydoides TaxID=89139 RepID=UPI0037442BE7
MADAPVHLLRRFVCCASKRANNNDWMNASPVRAEDQLGAATASRMEPSSTNLLTTSAVTYKDQSSEPLSLAPPVCVHNSSPRLFAREHQFEQDCCFSAVSGTYMHLAA